MPFHGFDRIVSCCLFRGTVLAALFSLARIDAAETLSESPPEDLALGWQTYLVLQKACSECHGGHLTKPKGKLGYILDLPRLVEEAYVIPGQPERSDLFDSMITKDPDLHMPPDDSEGPKPTAEEIEIIRRWIAAGASVSAGADTGPDEATPDPAPDEAEPAAELSLSRLLGQVHPLVVHFPVALLLCAAAAEIFLRIRPSLDWLSGMVRGCIWIGAVSALLAVASGWLHAANEGFGATADQHRWLGLATAAASVVLVSIHAVTVRRTGRRIWLLVSLIAVSVLVFLAGHSGGRLTYGDDFFPLF